MVQQGADNAGRVKENHPDRRVGMLLVSKLFDRSSHASCSSPANCGGMLLVSKLFDRNSHVICSS